MLLPEHISQKQTYQTECIFLNVSMRFMPVILFTIWCCLNLKKMQLRLMKSPILIRLMKLELSLK